MEEFAIEEYTESRIPWRFVMAAGGEMVKKPSTLIKAESVKEATRLNGNSPRANLR